MKLPFFKTKSDKLSETPNNRSDKLKKIIFGIVVCSLVGICVLFTFQFLPVLASKTTATTTEQELGSQITVLGGQVSNLRNIISELQSKITVETAISSTPASTTDVENVSDNVNMLMLSLGKLASQAETLEKEIQVLHDSQQVNNTQVGILQQDVRTLQENLKANATNIGTSSMLINGLDITFITNYIDTGMAGFSTATTAQFAIKISNNTSSVVSNLDVTGTITSLQSLSVNMAPGYPQVTDAAGISSIAYSYAGGNTIFFESYGGSKTLSIPVGDSITIRPKVSILATKDNKIPATTFYIALNAITYDVGATK